jgi:hypothetical protein
MVLVEEVEEVEEVLQEVEVETEWLLLLILQVEQTVFLRLQQEVLLQLLVLILFTHLQHQELGQW